TIPALPEATFTDPFPNLPSEPVYDETDNLNLTSSSSSFRRRRHIIPKSLQSRADRDVTLCQKSYDAPFYSSWHSNGLGNTYRPFYSYQWDLPSQTCTSYSFSLIKSALAQPDDKEYATEHIYELQLVRNFLTWMLDNDPGIKSWLSASNKRNICSGVYNKYLIPTQQWHLSNIKWGTAQGSSTTKGSRPMDDLISQFSGGTSNSNEMVYLESKINGIKALYFGGKTPNIDTLWREKLVSLARASLMFEYLADDTVKTTYKAVSNRMLDFWTRMDEAAKPRAVTSKPAKDIKWAEGYKKWEKQFLEGQDRDWQAWKNTMLDSVEVELAAARPPATVEKAVLASVRAARLGKLSNAQFRAAHVLKRD
ncbi:hypothetical protein QBC38DRAFT_447334, partial [Podospora fimiseda]